MPNPRNSPGKGLGSNNKNKPKVRAQSGSGRGGGLVPRNADNAPNSGPKKPQKGNPRAKPGGQMVSPSTKTPQTQRASGPPSGGGGGGRSGPPSAGSGGSGGRPQGGGQSPAKRGNTQPTRGARPGPRGSVWGGNLSAADPPAKRPSDIMDNLLFDAIRNTDSAAGALFRTLLRGVAGGAGVAADMAMAPELNKGEASQLEGAKADAIVNRSQVGSGPEAPMQPSQSSGEQGQSQSGDSTPKPDQKPSQGPQNGSQGFDKSQGQSQGDGGATLPDDASLGDKIAYGQQKGHPVIEHEGKIYKHDPDSPTGYRFAGRMDNGQGSQEAGVNKSSSGPEGSPADQGGYGMKDFMNDLREGPSEQEAKRIQERFSSRDR